MPGRHLTVPWERREVRAWVPDPIAEVEFKLDEATIRATERAAAIAERTSELALGLEVAGRFLLRAEGLGSSFIEGINASAADVAIAEQDEALGGAAGWVADNLAAVRDALADDGPLTETALLDWHRRLMRHAQLDRGFVGAWRDRQGWVGGPNPLMAAFVPPPADEIGRLIEDLIVFANRDDLDAVTLAAVTHAQFETIHPFADGNGRIGRVLIARILKQRLAIAVPPPVSAQFARDIGGYLSGLTLWREDRVDLWVRWFATSIENASVAAAETLAAVDELRQRWRERTRDLRSDASARRLLKDLVSQPVLSASSAAALLDVSHEAARNALATLGQRGILERAPQKTAATSPVGRPATLWIASELLRLIP